MLKPRIGIAGPFSGPRVGYGKMLKNQVANSSLATHADIFYVDDQAIPEQATQVAKILVQHGVMAVIGHFNSACAEEVSGIYAAAKIPLLLPASTKPSLTKQPLVFRICPDDHQQIIAMRQFVAAYTPSQITLWCDDSAYALSLKELLLQEHHIRWVNLNNLCHEPRGILICLGAHYRVANKINTLRLQYPTLPILCCDDCAIAEFIELIAETKYCWLLNPQPDFIRCTHIAIDLAQTYLLANTTDDFSTWLKSLDKLFSQQQYHAASFQVIAADAYYDA